MGRPAPANQPRSGRPKLSAVPGGRGRKPAGPRASLALDRLIHERVRLAIVSALAVNEALSFNELKALLGTTDGNLSVHARRLEEAGYVECLKTFAGRMPRTVYRLTAEGRGALERYLTHMEGLIRSTRVSRGQST
ncbi:MAG: winged helix-turn-helix domain-containing protein [Gemmatimonadales bacterium]